MINNNEDISYNGYSITEMEYRLVDALRNGTKEACEKFYDVYYTLDMAKGKYFGEGKILKQLYPVYYIVSDKIADEIVKRGEIELRRKGLTGDELKHSMENNHKMIKSRVCYLLYDKTVEELLIEDKEHEPMVSRVYENDKAHMADNLYEIADTMHRFGYIGAEEENIKWNRNWLLEYPFHKIMWTGLYLPCYPVIISGIFVFGLLYKDFHIEYPMPSERCYIYKRDLEGCYDGRTCIDNIRKEKAELLAYERGEIENAKDIGLKDVVDKRLRDRREQFKREFGWTINNEVLKTLSFVNDYFYPEERAVITGRSIQKTEHDDEAYSIGRIWSVSKSGLTMAQSYFALCGWRALRESSDGKGKVDEIVGRIHMPIIDKRNYYRALKYYQAQWRCFLTLLYIRLNASQRGQVSKIHSKIIECYDQIYHMFDSLAALMHHNRTHEVKDEEAEKIPMIVFHNEINKIKKLISYIMGNECDDVLAVLLKFICTEEELLLHNKLEVIFDNLKRGASDNERSAFQKLAIDERKIDLKTEQYDDFVEEEKMAISVLLLGNHEITAKDKVELRKAWKASRQALLIMNNSAIQLGLREIKSNEFEKIVQREADNSEVDAQMMIAVMRIFMSLDMSSEPKDKQAAQWIKNIRTFFNKKFANDLKQRIHQTYWQWTLAADDIKKLKMFAESEMQGMAKID